MKNIIIFCLLALWHTHLVAQSVSNIEVAAFPKEVTVFLAGAEVRHQESIKLKAGKTEIRFTDITYQVDYSSIVVSADNNVKIISTSAESGKRKTLKNQAQIDELSEKIKALRAEITRNGIETQALEAERAMINNSNNRIGKDGATAVDLLAAADFYRSRTKEIATKMYEIQLKNTEISKKVQELDKEYAKIARQKDNACTEIIVLVECKEATTATFSLSYITMQAGWLPRYNFKATKIGVPIRFEYKGEITNSTRIDWENVKLKLSTANPSQSMTMPLLAKWNLDFMSNEYYAQSKANMYNNNMAQQQQVLANEEKLMFGSADAGDEGGWGDDAGESTRRATIEGDDFAEIVVSELSTEFEIKQTFSVPADDKSYVADINEYDLKANYQYVAIPKMDKDAFLTAQILGWESLNLISGAANMYFNDSYVGQSYIDTRLADDTLTVSLGRDKRIMVTRTKQKDFKSKKYLGSSQTDAFAYEINVRNTNDVAIDIEIKDQLPVPTTSEIVLEEQSLGGANKDFSTNELSWKLNVPPTSNKTVMFSYTLKYPKNKRLNLNRTRQVQQYNKK